MYKEDFERERMDRERAAAKIDFLEEKVKKIIESQERKEAEQKRQIDLLVTTEAEQKHKLAERFQSEIDEERKKVEKAQEEVHVKASQVKQYKKQVDTLQRDLKEAQENAKHYKLLAKCMDQEESAHVCTYTQSCILYLHVYVCVICPVGVRILCSKKSKLCYAWLIHKTDHYAP